MFVCNFCKYEIRMVSQLPGWKPMFSYSAWWLASTDLLLRAFWLRVRTACCRRLLCTITATAIPWCATKPSTGVPARLVQPNSNATNTVRCWWNCPRRVKTWVTVWCSSLIIRRPVAVASWCKTPASMTIVSITCVSDVQTMTSNTHNIATNEI